MTTQVTKAVAIIKAAPQVGKRHGETVCCAAIDLSRNWHRLYPISFRDLKDGQKFGRWDIIQFQWTKPRHDSRRESRHVVQHSIGITGKLKANQRPGLLRDMIVTSLKKEEEKGNSLALLKAEILDFTTKAKTEDELREEAIKLQHLQIQPDMFGRKPPLTRPCPHKFIYSYRSDDGKHTGTCQDWETDATYYYWVKRYGEADALKKIKEVLGVRYPKDGMLLAMGTHSQYPVWLINGIIRFPPLAKPPANFGLS